MKLFKKLAAIHSGTYHEDKLIKYIMRWVKSSVKNVTIEYDHVNNNLYFTKGVSDTYPCIVAHLDQVQQPYPEDIQIIETEDVIFSYSPSQRSTCGLGGDDKCGIWIALKLLQAHDVIKVAFFAGEEHGCIGSREAHMEFFDDVRFVIEPDRRGNSDLIVCIDDYLCSDEFLEDIDYEKFGLQQTRGLMTDVNELKGNGLKVSCINVSCGYYEPHTEHEFVVKVDMENTLNFCDHVVRKCKKVYPHESMMVNDYRNFRYNFFDDGFDDDDYNYKIGNDMLDDCIDDIIYSGSDDLTAEGIYEELKEFFPDMTVDQVKERLENLNI
jgi:hypothetical protein